LLRLKLVVIRTPPSVSAFTHENQGQTARRPTGGVHGCNAQLHGGSDAARLVADSALARGFLPLPEPPGE
jgi:hypothetical protein